MPMSASGMPVQIASTKKLATRASDTRLEIVMVSRSLEAANAIKAGNSSNLIASAIMIPSAGWRYPPTRARP